MNKLLLLLLLAPLLLAPARAAADNQPAATLDPEFMGMVIRDPWYEAGGDPTKPTQVNTTFLDSEGRELANLGVRWVRLDVQIVVPPETPSDKVLGLVQAELAKNDYFINVVAPRHSLKVLALLSFDLLKGSAYPSALNSSASVASRFGGGVNAYMDTWLTRALLVADRYGSNIAAYEVLNEQNRLTKPQIDPEPKNTSMKEGDGIAPAILGRLITKFYRFCRGIDVPADEQSHGCKDASIIMGGLHPRGSSFRGNQPTDAVYLSEVYNDAASFKGFYDLYGRWPLDGIGYHPYPEEIRQSRPADVYVDEGIERIRAALENAPRNDGGENAACTPMWITEVGYNVGQVVNRVTQTESGQAAFLQDIYTSLAGLRVCGSQVAVPHIFWFKYEDFPPASGVNAQRWGLVRIPFTTGPCPGGECYAVDGVPAERRQAYLTYRELAGLPIQRISLSIIANNR